MDINASIWDLMAKKIAGELSSEEEETLNSLMEQHPNGKEIFSQLDHIWKAAGKVDRVNVSNELSLWEKLEHKLDIDEQAMAMKALDHGTEYNKINRKQASGGYWQEPRKMPISLALLIASIVAIVAISTIHFLEYKGPKKAISYPIISFAEFNILPSKPIEISLSSDSLQLYTLPDRSKVWLNKNSQLFYTPDFGDTVRRVRLTGEAFFEIQKDKHKPFIISANGSETRVLGTTFNLKAYEKEDPVLIVVSGEVEFSNENSKKEKLVLVKGERGRLNKKGGKLVKEKNDEQHFLDWKHILVYKKEISFPSRYLSNEAAWKKSIINQTEIRGEIHNIATLATYKNIKLKVSYQRKRKAKSHIFTVYKSLGPGETISYKYRLADWFGKTRELRIEVIDASVSKN